MPLETATLKTIAAFLNSRDGGTLLIGVADDGTVHGLDSDYATLHKPGKDDRDQFQQHLANIISASMGPAAATNVRPTTPPTSTAATSAGSRSTRAASPSRPPSSTTRTANTSSRPSSSSESPTAPRRSTTTRSRSTSPSDGQEQPDRICRAEHCPHRRDRTWCRRCRRGARCVVRWRSKRPPGWGRPPGCHRLGVDPRRRGGYSWTDPSLRPQTTQVNISSDILRGPRSTPTVIIPADVVDAKLKGVGPVGPSNSAVRLDRRARRRARACGAAMVGGSFTSCRLGRVPSMP